MTTFKAIQHQEVGAGGAASITFSDIPQDYTDLVLVVSARSTDTTGSAWDDLDIRLNNASATVRRLGGTGSSVFSDTSQYALTPDSLATSNTFGNIMVTIPNYASTTQYKSFSVDGVTENNATAAIQVIMAGLYSSNSAVTSLVLDLISGNFVQYSSATLFGIKRAALPAPTNLSSDHLLEEVMLTSSAASVTFSGLDAYAALGYTNLQIRAVARSAGSGDDYIGMRFNSDSGSNYTRHQLLGNGSSVSSFAATGETKITLPNIPGTDSSANIFSASVTDLLDAFESSKYTTVRSLGGVNGASTRVVLRTGLWLNSNALTSVQLFGGSSNFVTGSRFSLYGSK